MHSFPERLAIVLVVAFACSWACGSPPKRAKPPEPIRYPRTVPPSLAPEHDIVRLPPPELRGHISILKPPTRGHWFSVILQECLLEAATVEITIRDNAGDLVLDGAATTALQWPNSTQSHWIELPDRYDGYTFEQAIFKSANGRVLYDTTEDGKKDDPAKFTIEPRSPVFLSIIVVDCEKLRKRALDIAGDHPRDT